MSDADREMKVDPARAKALIGRLQGVQDLVLAASKGRPVSGCYAALAITNQPSSPILLVSLWYMACLSV
jgi:hypothetical protein